MSKLTYELNEATGLLTVHGETYDGQPAAMTINIARTFQRTADESSWRKSHKVAKFHGLITTRIVR